MKSAKLFLAIFTSMVMLADAADFKAGSYSAIFNGIPWRLQFDDGRIRVSSMGVLEVEGTYTIAGDEISITDIAGPLACMGDASTGEYAWREGEKSLTLTRIEDICQGRMNVLGTATWVRE